MTTIHHGSPSCYTNNKCREDACKTAWAQYNREQRALRKARPLPEGRKHGVYTTYTNYSCRCIPCRKANTSQRKKRQEEG